MEVDIEEQPTPQRGRLASTGKVLKRRILYGALVAFAAMTAAVVASVPRFADPTRSLRDSFEQFWPILLSGVGALILLITLATFLVGLFTRWSLTRELNAVPQLTDRLQTAYRQGLQTSSVNPAWRER